MVRMWKRGCMAVVYEKRNGTGSGRILIQVLSGNPNEDNNIHPLSASWNLQQKYLYKDPIPSHDPSLAWQTLPPRKIKNSNTYPKPHHRQPARSINHRSTNAPYLTLSLSLSLSQSTHTSAQQRRSPKKNHPPPLPVLNFPATTDPISAHLCGLYIPAHHVSKPYVLSDRLTNNQRK